MHKEKLAQFSLVNKNHRIVASSVFFVVGAIALGYGFTGIDFAFGDDRWVLGRTSNFPLIGEIPTTTAFILGASTVMLGMIAVIIGARLTISNHSTIKRLWMIVSGLLLIAWAIWGIAFVFNAVLNRLPGGEEYNTVDVPCGPLGPCRFPSDMFYWINVGIMGAGLLMMIVGIKRSRVVTVN